MTASKVLRCRGYRRGSIRLWHSQCPFPAKGERTMVTEGYEQAVLPACGHHLAVRWDVGAYRQGSEKYERPVEEEYR